MSMHTVRWQQRCDRDYRPAPRPPVTWQQLVQAEPRLGDFERAATEAAANHWGGWASWLYDYGEFTRLLSDLSDRRTAYDHLVGVFRAAWRQRWGEPRKSPSAGSTSSRIAPRASGRAIGR
jgi:hypothetical protein